MRLHAWCMAPGISAADADSILTALRGAGIACSRTGSGSDGSPPPDGPGILLFDDPATAEALAARTKGTTAADCILAICVNRTPPPSGAAWALLNAGISDVLVWQDDEISAERVQARLERWATVDQLVRSPAVRDTIIGESAAWRAVVRQVVEVAHFTDSPVLLAGDTGTGKELLARLVHAVDARPSRAGLHVLDCTTIVPELAGSEFFGHERGAFTHAIAGRDGAFALADGGTLFLDEAGELSLTLQAELLRVIQEGTYKRVGGNSWRRTHFRLVAATNRDLLREVQEHRMRRDFYYRLAAWTIALPRLEDRREDILPLARHFLAELNGDDKALDLDSAVEEYLVSRAYPGNVRDLRQLVRRIGRRHTGPGPLTVGDVPEEDRAGARALASRPPEEPLRQAIRLAMTRGIGLKELTTLTAETAIELALEREAGSTSRAAKLLGVTDRALQLRRTRRWRRPAGRNDGSAE